MLELMERLFTTALPEFKHLEEFEWVGYPELKADMVQVILKTHPNIQRLGLMYVPPFFSSSLLVLTLLG